MHYTYLPYEQVFRDTDPDAETGTTEPVMAIYKGMEVSLTKTAAGHYTINRLFSTDPKDYMNTEFSPGAKICTQMVKLL